MPLIHGTSDEARSQNIATEIDAGRSPEQAAAIAYSVQRQAKKTHSDGDSAGNHVSDDARMDRPAVCEIRDWRVFGPGLHKKVHYYTPACMDRLVENFGRLSTGPAPEILATGKLGHDPEQRFSQSLGFLGHGRITDVGKAPDGIVVIRRMVNVPRLIGAAINAGLLPSGSVELIDSHPDPADKAETIQGPILTGVSFLGEEPPAVKGLGSPHAVYPDGRPVEPLDDAEFKTLLKSMVAVKDDHDSDRKFSDRYGHRHQLKTIAFSDMVLDSQERPTVDPQALIAALQQLPPDQLQQVLGAVQQAPPATPDAGQQMTEGMPTNVATPADATAPDAAYAAAFAECEKKFAAKFAEVAKEREEEKKEFSAITKRMGELEEAEKGRRDKSDAEMSAKFSARVFSDVDDAILAGRLIRADREDKAEQGVAILKGQRKTFGQVTSDEPEAVYAEWKKALMSRPKVFGEAADPKPAPAVRDVTAEMRFLCNTPSFRQQAPNVVAKVLKEAGAN